MRRRALLMMDGWQGRFDQLVDVVGETPKKYRIRAITRTRLAGRGRWLEPGELGLVPKAAIRILKPEPPPLPELPPSPD